MSLQRAQVNCERCYNLVKQHKGYVEKEAERTKTFLDDRLYNARNEAMKALEESGRQALKAQEVHRSEKIGVSTIELSNDALSTCASCDYKEPRIANLVKKCFEDKKK